jgi:GNAT superfamily N-acetyltransferase
MQFMEFVPSSMTEEEWSQYLDCRERIHSQLNPGDPMPSRAARRAYMLDPHPDFSLSWWRAESEPGRVVGMGGVWWTTKGAPNYEEAKNTAFADMILDQAHADHQSYSEFLLHLAHKADQLQITKIIVETRAEHQYPVLAELGGSVVSERATNRLRLSEVDWRTIERWRAEGPERARGVRIERFRAVPEEDLEEYSKIYTETWNQAPLEDAAPDMIVTPESRRKMEHYFYEKGEIWTTMVTRERNGEISGLTEIWFESDPGYYIEQGLTGVREKYRGRGLGKWLKAEMLTYAREQYPAAVFIEAGNADANAPMLSINARLGFRQYRKMWFVSFSVSELLQRL